MNVSWMSQTHQVHLSSLQKLLLFQFFHFSVKEAKKLPIIQDIHFLNSWVNQPQNPPDSTLFMVLKTVYYSPSALSLLFPNNHLGTMEILQGLLNSSINSLLLLPLHHQACSSTPSSFLLNGFSFQPDVGFKHLDCVHYHSLSFMFPIFRRFCWLNL